MFIAELGVEALRLEFYPGPSCMGKKTPKTAAAVHVTTGLCMFLLHFFPPPNSHTSVRSINEETCTRVLCALRWDRDRPTNEARQHGGNRLGCKGGPGQTRDATSALCDGSSERTYSTRLSLSMLEPPVNAN